MPKASGDHDSLAPDADLPRSPPDADNDPENSVLGARSTGSAGDDIPQSWSPLRGEPSPDAVAQNDEPDEGGGTASDATGCFFPSAPMRLAAATLAIWPTTLIGGIRVDTHSAFSFVLTLIAVAAIYGVCTAIFKPVIRTIGCIFYILTFGLIGIFVDGLLFLLAGRIADWIGLPFSISNLWPSAILGALAAATVTFVADLVIPRQI